MPGTRRSRYTSKEASARRRFLVGLLLFLLAVAAAIVWSDSAWRYLATAPAPVPSSAMAQPTSPAPVAPVHAERVAYPYSVIDGGARTVEELKRAIADDPIVAAHYANFSLEKTHVERLREPRLAHVSYRLGDAVYWTRKPVALRSGEAVLTDGVHVARTRCGNQLAETPGEVSPLEPPSAAMDLPANPALSSLLARLGPGEFPSRLPGGLLHGTTPLSAGSELLPLEPGTVSAPPLMLGSMPVGSGASSDITPEPGPDSPAPDGPAPPVPQPTPRSPAPLPTPAPSPAPGPSPTPGPSPAPAPPPVDNPTVPPPLNPPLIPPEILVPPGTDLPLPPGGGVEPNPLTPPEVPVPVPEPGTALFMIAGGIAYALRRLHPRRRD